MGKVKFVRKTSDDGHVYEVADMSRQFEGYVSQDGSGAGLDLEVIASAERALGRLSQGFDIMLEEDIGHFVAAHKAWRKAPSDIEALRTLYRRAFDLRGQAQTLGQPVIGDMASSLALLLEHEEVAEAIPAELVQAHVQAIRAAMIQRTDPASRTAATEIADALHEAVRLFFERQGVVTD